MEQEQLSLYEIALRGFENSPEQVYSVIQDYIDVIDDAEYAESLKSKLENDEFSRNFSLALIQTSSLFFVSAISLVQDDIKVDYDGYVMEYLHYAKNEDPFIRSARLFFIDALVPEDYGIEYSEDVEQLADAMNVDSKINKENVREMQALFNKQKLEVSYQLKKMS